MNDQSSDFLPPNSKGHEGKFPEECERFKREWRDGDRPSIEAFLEQADQGDRDMLLRVLMVLELSLSAESEGDISLQSYYDRFQSQKSVIDDVLQASNEEPTDQAKLLTATIDGSSKANPLPDHLDVGKSDGPEKIDRYQIIRKLGRGGFANVFLAHDPDLDREVALKVPVPGRLASSDARNLFVEEARKAAQLEHERIVRIHDVQRDASSIYIVQQYMPGGDLSQLIRKQEIPPRRVAEILRDISDAIGYAHGKRYVHLDLKPANILLNGAGEPFVADFGMALHESARRDKRGKIIGTLAYMSPEQVRGESHRFDGRSDIWSLGVILYELLVGERPFRANTADELMDQIKNDEPKPLRQINPDVPAELSRICLSCLAKRANDRYPSTADLVDDLECWLEQDASKAVGQLDSQANRQVDDGLIVPQGLRSFDSEHASTFLSLLPGPHDRYGYPKSIGFWKSRIEQLDVSKTFSVGLIYGPSGSGKSSWVKAGLLPRIDSDIKTFYVDATGEETTDRLMQSLKLQFPQASATTLVELIDGLRNGKLAGSRKVLLVIDQFEQWLHNWSGAADDPFVLALRQCDGANVQCLLLVRDDFWMSATRFFHSLEVSLVEGKNTAAIDLFDERHANKVLTILGQAHQRIGSPPTNSEVQFIKHCVNTLDSDGKFVCIRLAVFAEMMKARTWDMESFESIGGTEGVGYSFLEETFFAQSTPPLYRLHQAAIRNVLRALLPEPGSNIKGRMRSYDELFNASGYQSDSDFGEVMAILDNEVRLVTPTEMIPTLNESTQPDSFREYKQLASQASKEEGRKLYQLTHDFLVPPLRDWLTRKQRETSRGRAEIKLEERTSLWSQTKELRHGASFMEWLSILLQTSQQKWTPQQRNMMRHATKLHLRRMIISFTAISVLVFGVALISNAILKRQNEVIAEKVVEQIRFAEIANLDPLPSDLFRVQDISLPLLLSLFEQLDDESPEKLNVSLALLPSEPQLASRFLIDKLPSLLPVQVDVVSELLKRYANTDDVTEELVAQFSHQLASDHPSNLLPTAATLAAVAPSDERWQASPRMIADSLLEVDTVYVGGWLDQLRPVRLVLLRSFAELYLDANDTMPPIQRERLTSFLREYAFDQPELVADLLMECHVEDENTFITLASQFENRAQVVRQLKMALNTELVPDWQDSPTDSNWLSPTDADSIVVEQAHGMLDMQNRFAYCQTMKWSTFIDLAERLRPTGFRPIRIRPYIVGDETRVAAVWTRDGKDWALEFDLEQGQLPTSVDSIEDQLRRVPIDLARYGEQEDAAARYLILWGPRSNSEEARRISIDVAQDELDHVSAKMSEAGFTSATSMQLVINSDKKRTYCITWSNQGAQSTLVSAYGGWERLDQSHWDLAIAEPIAPDLRAIYGDRLVQINAELESNPNDEQLVFERARTHFYLENYSAALDDLEPFADDSLPAIFEYRAPLFALANREQEAIQDLVKLEAAGASEPQLRFATVLTRAYLGDQDAALNEIDLLDKPDMPAGNLYLVAHVTAVAARGYPGDSELLIDKSFELLERAIDAGYSYRDELLYDYGLVVMRGDPRFDELLNRLGAPESYSTILRPEIHWETRLSSRTSIANKLDRSREFAADGYRPLAIGVLADQKDEHSNRVDWGQVESGIVWRRPLIDDSAKEDLAIRKANAAAAIFKLDNDEPIAEYLSHQPDPRLRSFLIERLTNTASSSSDALISLLLESKDVSIQRALMLVLGNLAEESLLSERQVEHAASELLTRYRDDEDPGLHGAARWALLQLGRVDSVSEIDAGFATGEPIGNRDWYMTRNVGTDGETLSPLTMMVLTPDRPFLMGSIVSDEERYNGFTGQSERRHRRSINRRFAISSFEVTVSQFSQYHPEHEFNRVFARELDAPANVISWYEAAAYCNWLSEQEGIPQDQWCYDPNQPFDEGMTLPDDYLARTGYRLPTIAEWEYACRAGAHTSRAFGQTATLLSEYAWNKDNSRDRWLLPVGSLKPNDFGLFDMQGNVLEWCQGPPVVYDTYTFDTIIDREILEPVTNAVRRESRGGSFGNHAHDMRAPGRFPGRPDTQSLSHGFRVARTMQ